MKNYKYIPFFSYTSILFLDEELLDSNKERETDFEDKEIIEQYQNETGPTISLVNKKTRIYDTIKIFRETLEKAQPSKNLKVEKPRIAQQKRKRDEDNEKTKEIFNVMLLGTGKKQKNKIIFFLTLIL